MGHLLIHRGLAKKTLVENTLKSFRYCFQRNFGIETDLHATKDNKIVCFHDFNLKKQFKINKRINKINYKDLRDISKKKSLDLGLLIPSTFNFKNILLKSRKKYVKFLVLEKKFLTEKRLIRIKKRIYFYTIKKSTDFKKYKKFNLIFENL